MKVLDEFIKEYKKEDKEYNKEDKEACLIEEALAANMARHSMYLEDLVIMSLMRM